MVNLKTTLALGRSTGAAAKFTILKLYTVPVPMTLNVSYSTQRSKTQTRNLTVLWARIFITQDYKLISIHTHACSTGKKRHFMLFKPFLLHQQSLIEHLLPGVYSFTSLTTEFL